MSSIVLIGPYGTDPRFALYDEPVNSAGGRLRRRILGMHRRDYLRIPRYNLCVGAWSLKAARARASEIRDLHDGAFRVLLGRKVQQAFGFTATARQFSIVGSCVLLPHPSGRCLVWNDPQSIARTRVILLGVVPSLSLGVQEAT